MLLGLNGGWPINNSGGYDFPGSLYQQLPSIKASGASSIRLGFRLSPYYPDWSTPGADGSYALQGYDKVVNEAQLLGLSIMALADAETVNGPQSAWQENHNGDGNNHYLDNIIKSVQLLDTHYGGAIQSWEAWNEPNVWTRSYGSGGSFIYPTNFAALLTNMPSATKKTIISGGVTSYDWGSGQDYIDQTYQAGKKNQHWKDWPCAEIGQHYYIMQGGQVNQNAILKDLFQVNKPIVITEIGWQTSNVSQAVQSINLSTSYDAFRKAGNVSGYYWFAIQDGGAGYFGLRTTGSAADHYVGAAKPSFVTFQQISQGLNMQYPPAYAGNVKKALDNWWVTLLSTIPMDGEYAELHVEWVSHILNHNRNPGPPESLLAPSVDWSGNTIEAICFTNFRAEVNNGAVRWWDSAGVEVQP